jgi:ubiquinone biosynthesis protein
MKDDVIGLIDFGIVGRLDEDLREKIEEFFVGLISGNKDMIITGFFELGFAKGDINEEELKQDISEDLSIYYNMAVNKIKMSQAFGTIFSLAREYAMAMPQNLVLFMKAIVTAEAFGEEFDETFNFIKVCKPHIKEIIKKHKDPNHIMKVVKKSAIEYLELFKDFPKKFNKMSRKSEMEDDPVDQEDIKELKSDLSLALTRTTFGMVIAGLIIAGALTIQISQAPILGIFKISDIFFILALLVAIFTVIKTNRRN